MTVVVIITWYLVGAVAARTMVRDGHSAAPWCVSAVLLGALTWPVSVVVRRAAAGLDLGADPLASPDLIGSAPTLLAITADVDRADELARALADLDRPNRDALGVASIGIEAYAGWVDTGERRSGADALAQFATSMTARSGRGAPRPRTVVTVGSVVAVARRCRGLGLHCVALPRQALRSGLGWHRLAAIASVADATGASVLVVPTRNPTRRDAPSRRVAVPSRSRSAT